MHKKGKIALAVTAAAAATLFVGGGVYAANGTTAAVVSQPLSSAELKQVLVPDAQQPAYRSITAPITIQDAVAAHLFEPAPGLVASPSECLQLNGAIGDLSKMEGWLQTGERDASVAPSSPFRGFSQGVFQVPGGASGAIDRVASILSKCTAATIAIDLGGKTQHGITGFTEHSGATLAGARTYASTQVTVFYQETLQGIQEEECVAEVALLAQGDTLIWLQEPTSELLSAMVNDTYQRLQTAGGSASVAMVSMN